MNVPALIRLGPAAAGRCRRRIHLDHAPDATREGRSIPDAGVRMRFADMRAHVDRVLSELPAAVTDWNPESADRPAVVRPPMLRSGTRSGAPDLLIADGGGYLPVIIRGHRTLDPMGEVEVSTLGDPFTMAIDRTRRRRKHPTDLLQLAHHHALLTELGLASTNARGGVIGRAGAGGPAAGTAENDGQLIVWHDLSPIAAEYADRFADRLEVAAAAKSGGALALPSRIAECARCPWWPVCSAELEAAHDISLLAAGSDVTTLQQAGYFTLDDLVAGPARVVKSLPLTSIPPGEARVRAKARLDGLPMVRRTHDTVAPRADVEMDVDMESYFDQGAYLWGTLLSGADIGFDRVYRPFATFDDPADDPADGAAAEGVNFVAFWQYLTGVRTACQVRGLTFAAYCWSRTAEERWLYSTPRRYPEVPEMPTEGEISAFCSSEQWVDLYAEVKARFVVPGSLRLKAIAPVAGFRWRDSEPGGENSMAWYRAAVGADELPGRPDPVLRLSMRQRLLDYNEDDVRATAAVRHWMGEGALALPTIGQLLARIDLEVHG
jgi:predicted RecB family nuclease